MNYFRPSDKTTWLEGRMPSSHPFAKMIHARDLREKRTPMAMALRAVIKLAMDAQHSDEEIIACLRDLIDDIRNKTFWSKL